MIDEKQLQTVVDEINRLKDEVEKLKAFVARESNDNQAYGADICHIRGYPRLYVADNS